MGKNVFSWEKTSIFQVRQIFYEWFFTTVNWSMSKCQGWEFTLSLLAPWLFRFLLFWSKSHILKSDCERFALVSLIKRATMRYLLPSIFKSDREHHSCCSLQRSDCEQIALFVLFAHDSSKSLSKTSDLLMIRANRSKNEWFAPKNSYFLYVFDSFSNVFPFFMTKSESLSQSLLGSGGSDLLSSLFTKERPSVFHSILQANHCFFTKEHIWLSI